MEVFRQYGINTNQLSLWRKQFIGQGHQAFEGDALKGDAKFRKKIEQLDNLIGKGSENFYFKELFGFLRAPRWQITEYGRSVVSSGRE